jgi:hypothetical protein
MCAEFVPEPAPEPSFGTDRCLATTHYSADPESDGARRQGGDDPRRAAEGDAVLALVLGDRVSELVDRVRRGVGVEVVEQAAGDAERGEERERVVGVVSEMQWRRYPGVTAIAG